MRAVLIAAAALAPLTRSGDAVAEPVRVDAGLTGSSVAVDDRSGAGMMVEIKGLVNDHVAVGGRVEFGVMFGGRVGNEDETLDVAMAACGLLKAEVSLGRGPVRPFVGFGVGGYTLGGQTIGDSMNGTYISQQSGRYFGVAPQVGVDLGRVRLAATYHALLGATLEVQNSVGTAPPMTSTLSQNFLSLELSFQFTTGRPATRNAL